MVITSVIMDIQEKITCNPAALTKAGLGASQKDAVAGLCVLYRISENHKGWKRPLRPAQHHHAHS